MLLMSAESNAAGRSWRPSGVDFKAEEKQRPVGERAHRSDSYTRSALACPLELDLEAASFEAAVAYDATMQGLSKKTGF